VSISPITGLDSPIALGYGILMKIPQADVTIRNKPVLVRLTSETYEWLTELAARAGGGIATTIRNVLEAAQEEGVEVEGENDTGKHANG
jgi:hypothetical protein